MKIFAALTFAIFISGCMSVGISRAEKSAAGAKAEEYDVSSYVWGFIPSHLPPESQLCPKSRVETIHLGQTGSDVFITILTLGIYVPQRAEFSCAAAVNGSH